tara:strand:- start:75725 stop:76663 length:939 start_codon:yes stop_codon:yes gene_type:complete
MKNNTTAQLMHNFGAQVVEVDPFSQRLLKHTQYLTNIKLIYRLTSAVQQHRGCTMASLSGCISFFERIKELQAIVNKSFFALKLNNLQLGELMHRTQLGLAVMDWNAIQQGWQNDTVLDNYEFHGHLIYVLNQMSKQYLDEILEGCEPELKVQHESFFNIILVELLGFIEQIAKLRGLSTNSAVLKTCGLDSYSRITFLIKDIRIKNNELTDQIGILSAEYEYIPSKQKLNKQKQRINKIAKIVETKILNTRVILESSEDLFDLMTEIIDMQWFILGTGLDLADRLIFDGLYVQSKLNKNAPAKPRRFVQDK